MVVSISGYGEDKIAIRWWNAQGGRCAELVARPSGQVPRMSGEEELMHCGASLLRYLGARRETPPGAGLEVVINGEDLGYYVAGNGSVRDGCGLRPLIAIRVAGRNELSGSGSAILH